MTRFCNETFSKISQEGLTPSKNWYLFSPPNSECFYLEFKARCDILIWTYQKALARYLETINALFRCDRWFFITWFDHGLSDLWDHVACTRILFSQWSAANYYQHRKWSDFTRLSGPTSGWNFTRLLKSEDYSVERFSLWCFLDDASWRSPPIKSR